MFELRDLEWFRRDTFVASYERARRERKKLVSKKTNQIVADFGDRKDKISNPVIEVHGPDGLMIVSRIVNFQHELRQVALDVPVTLMLDGVILAKLPSIKELLEAKNA